MKDLSSLTVVRMGPVLSDIFFEKFLENIKMAFENIIEKIIVLESDPLQINKVPIELLTEDIKTRFGKKHILVITEIVLSSADEEYGFVFGGKDKRSNVAATSSFKLRDKDPGITVKRLSVVGAHELGHNFYLSHHYQSSCSSYQALECPMWRGESNRHTEESYVRSVIDKRGIYFCDKCYRILSLFQGQTS